MRNALTSRQSVKDATAAFENNAPEAPKFLAAKDKLSAADRTELTRVQERLAILCGPNGNDGLAQQSWNELCDAENELNRLLNEYMQIRNLNFNLNDRAALVAAILGDNPADPAIIEKKAALTNAARVQAEKKAANEAAYNEINSLAIWNGPQVVGGREFDLKLALEEAALNRKAQEHCQKMATFFKELNTSLTVQTGTLQLPVHVFQTRRSEALNALLA